MTDPAREPGAFLLDRFLPDAPEEMRTRALDAFRRYGRHLSNLGRALDQSDQPTWASSPEDGGHRRLDPGDPAASP
ncbi:hypothetical protein M9M90_01045 [Phenylobacterium sp. LH3H17]|uniref:hypothetical protein n=1 Tax=Phenylobacterium sp. LH3H17 TaxID=2903901 RepID=UPI0020C9F2CC|nr:hypothetical protein [Phenylobacterium sp. LH3H17]UTP39791.1 hypothetical protein M9M90_01045 [Phenylobacterium sp. LH3H17]